MVGITTPKDTGSKVGVKASTKSFGRSKSPPLPNVIVFGTMFVPITCTTCLLIILLFKNPVTSQSNSKKDKYIIEIDVLPNNSNFYPTVANGYLGMKLFGDTIYVAGLYNGYHGNSHRARLPCSLPYIFDPRNSTTLSSKQFVQNMAEGTFKVAGKFSNTLHTTQTIYAHARYQQLLVTEISITSSNPGSWKLPLISKFGRVSADVDFEEPFSIDYDQSMCPCMLGKDTCNSCKYLLTAQYIHGKTKTPEESFAPQLEIHVIYSKYPSFLSDNSSTTAFKFFTSVGKTRREAEYFYKKGLRKNIELLRLHKLKWKSIWGSGKINVDGHFHTNQVITSSLYYLLSSFPFKSSHQQSFSPQFFGVSPGGLSNGGKDQIYLGHVFWDQDFWMMPALLPFYPELVKMVIHYRVRRLPEAHLKAKSFNFHGAMFPWETGYTGADVCPGEDYIKREIHITSDIIHLLKQYIYMTQDWKIFDETVPAYKVDKQKYSKKPDVEHSLCKTNTGASHFTAWDLLRDTANFWLSRVRASSDRTQYVIDDVMGPDEWHTGVNNSAFTNVAARENMLFAAQVADRFGICPKLAKRWRHVARRTFPPFDAEKRYHPEFDGFAPGQDIVKQADAVMLSFPLMYSMPDDVRVSPDVRANDLDIYRSCTSREGPAMSWGIFSVNYLQLNRSADASVMYLRQLDNVQAPFMVWSEKVDGSGATNFLTGMGGYLQSVLYGYWGLRVKKDKLVVNPKPISTGKDTSSRMTLSELRYRGFVLDLFVDSALEIRIVALEWTAVPCLAVIKPDSPSPRFSLCSPGDFVVVQVGRWLLQPLD